MPISNQAHTNAKAVECQASAISPTLASTNPTTTPSTTNNKEEGRRTSGGTKQQVHTSTKASQHNGHLVGSIGVEQVPPVMVTTTTHHHPQPQPMRVVLEETPWHPHNSHQPWSPHSALTMVWSCCLVCVCESDGQCLASWPQCCHLHQATTHAPHTDREREAWMEQERQWRVRAQQMVWKWLAKQASHKHHNNDCAQTTVTK